MKIKEIKKKIHQLENENKSLNLYICTLERQLSLQEDAINRKDEEYKALKKLYKDDLINALI